MRKTPLTPFWGGLGVFRMRSVVLRTALLSAGSPNLGLSANIESSDQAQLHSGRSRSRTQRLPSQVS